MIREKEVGEEANRHRGETHARVDQRDDQPATREVPGQADRCTYRDPDHESDHQGYECDFEREDDRFDQRRVHAPQQSDGIGE